MLIIVMIQSLAYALLTASPDTRSKQTAAYILHLQDGEKQQKITLLRIAMAQSGRSYSMNSLPSTFCRRIASLQALKTRLTFSLSNAQVA